MSASTDWTAAVSPIEKSIHAAVERSAPGSSRVSGGPAENLVHPGREPRPVDEQEVERNQHHRGLEREPPAAEITPPIPFTTADPGAGSFAISCAPTGSWRSPSAPTGAAARGRGSPARAPRVHQLRGDRLTRRSPPSPRSRRSPDRNQHHHDHERSGTSPRTAAPAEPPGEPLLPVAHRAREHQGQEDRLPHREEDRATSAIEGASSSGTCGRTRERGRTCAPKVATCPAMKETRASAVERGLNEGPDRKGSPATWDGRYPCA